MSSFASRLPSTRESEIAKQSSRELSGLLEANSDVQLVSITDSNGQIHPIQLPVTALKFLVDVLTELGDGNTVKLVPVHAELTTQEAADILDMSRPALIKLLDDKAIPFTRTGNRRKVRFADIQALKDRLESDRLATLEELSTLDQELGMGS